GFSSDEEELQQLSGRLQKLKNGKLVALHCHFGAGARDAEAYGLRAQNMLSLLQQYFSGFPIELIDTGGGFFSRMNASLKAQFGNSVPDYKQYTEALCRPFANFSWPGKKPAIMIEPGNALA